MDWTMEMVASVVPMRIPPPINMDMLVALAQMMEPMHAINGGMVANSLRSKTSDKRPTGGERTDCMRSGPYRVSVFGVKTSCLGLYTWMIQLAIAGSPSSRMMNDRTDPAATTTKTCDMTLHDRLVRS